MRLLSNSQNRRLGHQSVNYVRMFVFISPSLQLLPLSSDEQALGVQLEIRTSSTYATHHFPTLLCSGSHAQLLFTLGLIMNVFTDALITLLFTYYLHTCKSYVERYVEFNFDVAHLTLSLAQNAKHSSKVDDIHRQYRHARNVRLHSLTVRTTGAEFPRSFASTAVIIMVRDAVPQYFPDSVEGSCSSFCSLQP